MSAALEIITASNWREALAVRVQEERLAFVASIQPVALIMLAKCWVNPDGQHWFPFLLRDEGQVVVTCLPFCPPYPSRLEGPLGLRRGPRRSSAWVHSGFGACVHTGFGGRHARRARAWGRRAAIVLRICRRALPLG